MSTRYYRAQTGERIYGAVVSFDILCCKCAMQFNKKRVFVPVYLTKEVLKDFIYQVDGKNVCFCHNCGTDLVKYLGAAYAR